MTGARMRRLGLFAVTTVLSLLALGGCAHTTPPAPAPAARTAFDPLLDDVARRTFDWFWETSDPVRGLVPDRAPSPTFSSVASIGFGLTAYGIGAERGWISREAARRRTLATLRFLLDAPQGPEQSGKAGYRGFFYHFLDAFSGTRYANNELSTADTGLLMLGVLFAQSYFDGSSSEEAEIRRLAERLYARVDWKWATPRGPLITMGWKPESGLLPLDWCCYNEAMFVYVLALGSPTHAVGKESWDAWTASYGSSWGTLGGQPHLTFGPHFGHQFTASWIDLRGIRDAYMRERGFDYFENSRRATYAQRAYAIENPLRWKGYGENVWGLSACDGPVDAVLPYEGSLREFRTYAARGVNLDPANNYDDGTITPMAAIGSLPFAPEIVVPALHEMHARYGRHIYGRYGFYDAFNPSFDYDVPLRHGRRVPGFGWVDTDHIGIDQGPILLMIENHRDGFVWSVMRRNAHLRRGLERAGFTGGWLQ